MIINTAEELEDLARKLIYETNIPIEELAKKLKRTPHTISIMLKWGPLSIEDSIKLLVAAGKKITFQVEDL